MPGAIDLSVVIAYTVGLIVLYLLFRLLWLPAKLMLRGAYSLLVGALGILLFNAVGSYLSVHIPFNALSVVSVGFLGIPGIGLILALRTLF
jgi:inhibitor of the pro-sigma K processing machinery